MQACLRERAHQLGGDADVLNDERVCAGTICLASGFKRIVDLVRQNCRVQRNVHVDAAQVSVRASIRKRFQREIVSAAPSVKRLQAQIDRIGTALNCGMKRRHAASWRQQFHFPIHKTTPVYARAQGKASFAMPLDAAVRRIEIM